MLHSLSQLKSLIFFISLVPVLF